MPKTNAQYQAAHRERRKRLLAGLQAANARLEAENAALRSEVASLESALALANADFGGAEWQDAGEIAARKCAHPAESIDNGQCTGCGEWL